MVLGRVFKPMLADRVTDLSNIEQLMKKKPFCVETKYDGERMQVRFVAVFFATCIFQLVYFCSGILTILLYFMKSIFMAHCVATLQNNVS